MTDAFSFKPVPTRAELLAAVDDPDPRNPLAIAIADVIARYADELSLQADLCNGMPNPVVLPVPETEIEAFALELFTADIAALGIRIVFDQPGDMH